MGLMAIEWKVPPGEIIPLPRIQDDAESFPENVVKFVRDWLKSVMPAFDGRKPTAQTIANVGMHGDLVIIPHGSIQGMKDNLRFRPSTAEVCLIEKGAILIKHRFMVAREINGLGHATGRDIAGPKLLDIQDSSLPLIEIVTS